MTCISVHYSSRMMARDCSVENTEVTIQLSNAHKISYPVARASQGSRCFFKQRKVRAPEGKVPGNAWEV